MLPENVLHTPPEELDPVYQPIIYTFHVTKTQEYKIRSFKKQIRNNLVFLPNGVSTKIALNSSVGFEAMLTASICSKLPSG